jgi:hypothetical protein
VDAKEAIVTALRPVAEGAEPGSELGAIAEQVRKLKESEPELGAQVQSEYEELMELVSRKPDAVQAKAKEMVEMLGGNATGS